MSDVDTLRRLVQAFPSQTKPLEPGSPLYVEDLHLEGEGEVRDPVEAFGTLLALGEAPSVSLFSGLIGSGKSTELRRLKDFLWLKFSQRAFVLDMGAYVNLNSPIQITDLLVSIIAALSDLVEEETGTNPITNGPRLREFYEVLKSKILLKDFEIDTKIGLKLKGSLKQDPSFKQKVQEQLGSDLTTLLSAAKQACGELHEALQKSKGTQASFILLLDSLEQLQDTDVRSDQVKNSLVHLYTQFLDQLHLPGFKMVYSVPPYLVNLIPQLTTRLGVICRLTNVHVFQDRSRKLDDRGVKQLREVAERRLKDIGKLDSLIEPLALNEIIRASGGELRSFFTMIRSTAIFELGADSASLPLKLASAQGALRQMRNSLGLLTDDIVERLVKIDANHEPELTNKDSLNALAQDLDTKRVMLYRNGQDWYGVNPLLWIDIDAHTKVTVRG